MYDLLKGLRVVEGASFIAAPLCGLTFAQLGAEVIRFDQIGGGLDYTRWPLAPNGASLYWEGLNKGKRSVAVDLARPEGRELAIAIITASGENGGLFVTNYPHDGFLSHDKLTRLRADLITLRVTGSSDGTSALDYTINSAVGYPLMTGPAGTSEPINHVLPAWDVSCGLLAATTLLAAERERSRSGAGREIRLALSDVAFATLGNLGQIAEVTVSHEDRPRIGNVIYGAFGRDFRTRDARYVMIAAITRKQWLSLLDALNIHGPVQALEKMLGIDLSRNEGVRFQHREGLMPIVEEAIATMPYEEVAARFDAAGVCWGPYRTVREALALDHRLSTANPMFQMVQHPSGQRYLTPGYPAAISGMRRGTSAVAPQLGEHTDEVLAQVLGLDAAAIGRLHDRKLVAGAGHVVRDAVAR